MVFMDPITKYAAYAIYMFNIIQTYVRTFEEKVSVEPEKITRDFLEVKMFTKKSIIQNMKRQLNKSLSAWNNISQKRLLVRPCARFTILKRL